MKGGIQWCKLVRLPVNPQYFTLSIIAAVSSSHALLRGSPVEIGAGSIGKGFATLEPKKKFSEYSEVMRILYCGTSHRMEFLPGLAAKTIGLTRRVLELPPTMPQNYEGSRLV